MSGRLVWNERRRERSRAGEGAGGRGKDVGGKTHGGRRRGDAGRGGSGGRLGAWVGETGLLMQLLPLCRLSGIPLPDGSCGPQASLPAQRPARPPLRDHCPRSRSSLFDRQTEHPLFRPSRYATRSRGWLGNQQGGHVPLISPARSRPAPRVWPNEVLDQRDSPVALKSKEATNWAFVDERGGVS